LTKRTVLAVAAGVVAGATVVGVPAFAYADAGNGVADSHMESVMDDPEFFDRMKDFMTEMMSDPQMQEQMQDHMRSMMESMEDMPSMGGMGDMGDMHGGGRDGDAPAGE
jgi:hypothetical protein